MTDPTAASLDSSRRYLIFANGGYMAADGISRTRRRKDARIYPNAEAAHTAAGDEAHRLAMVSPLRREEDDSD